MSFLDKVHPERPTTGFTKFDGTVRFYGFVKAIMAEVGTRRALDYGAGRGALLATPNQWRRDLVDLRQGGAEVYACDIDPVVKEHPGSDHQIVIEPGSILPFEDGYFDVIVSDVTFEHIEDPVFVSRELLRILRPGGYICARTPNKFGYAKIATGLVPNRFHVPFLRKIQPGRRAEDVFPTFFRMNSVRSVKKLFPGCAVGWYRDSAEPAYYFGMPVLYKIMMAAHKLLPDVMSISICFFIKKPM